MVEQQPRKYNLDWEGFREYVFKKYTGHWPRQCFSYAKKYAALINNPSKLETFSKFKKNNVLKALIALSKYHGFYREFRERIKDYGIKWSQSTSIESFLRILRNNHKDILEWYHKATNALNEDCQCYLELLVKSGIRVSEAVKSFNLIRRLEQQGKLSHYYNEELKTLEHFRFPSKFLRGTKNVFITMIPKDFILEVAKRDRVSYSQIRMKLRRQKIPLRMNQLRDFYGTFMVRQGLIKEEVDLLQGRIGESIFVRHYWSPAIKELQKRVFKALDKLEEQLLEASN